MSSPEQVCAFCLDPCSLACAHCKKVSYCSKNHQKFDRRAHRPICYPAKLEWSSGLGNHLIATRDIDPGQVIVEDRALVVGPRSNLPKSATVCLGCCDLVSQHDSYECPACHWLFCRPECVQSSWHRNNECKIFESNNVGRPSTSDEFLFVTILRCILIKSRNPETWTKFTRFEFHGETRKRKREASQKSVSAADFIQNKCKQTDADLETIDRIYGILTVNGYSDASKYFVKLYEIGSKISHSCLPNTRSMAKMSGKNGENVLAVDSKLVVISTSQIKAGEPLTQLYGNLLTGTHRRQELLQNVYLFTCTCARCSDPSEFGTNFSGILCQNKKCRKEGSVVLPEKPLDQSSGWICPKCDKRWSYKTLVFPALREVAEVTQLTLDDPLFSEFEFYAESGSEVPLVGPDVAPMKADYAVHMDAAVQKLGKEAVHPNHYSLLPVKTAVIATIYSLIGKDEEEAQILPLQQLQTLSQVLLRNVNDVLNVLNVISPGMTRNRGILLFYLARCNEICQKVQTAPKTSDVDNKKIWAQAQGILSLEPATDDYLKMLENHRRKLEQN